MASNNPQDAQSRTSSGSARAHASRNINPDKQISQIEKSVTHLLVATKQLLETLTQWSRKQAQEEEVSDVYVRLGYEFNLACRAFNSIGVDTSDLGPVPDLLRSILEDTLSQPASPQALDNYLPRIRDIIINLLHGLKRKQGKLRGRPSKDGAPGRAFPARQASGSSIISNETGLTTMLEDVPSQVSNMRSESRSENNRPMDDQGHMTTTEVLPATERGSTSIKRQSFRRDANRPMAQSESNSSMSSNAAQNMPVLPPYSDPDQTAAPSDHGFSHPPPPPPKQQDALTALQRGGDLERRASRRFSAYQIQKHLGASPNGIPTIPIAQNSPIPNRGPRGNDVRESMSAVRSRTSYQHGRTKSSQRVTDGSPSRAQTTKAPQRISEELEEPPTLATNLNPARTFPVPEEPIQIDSPTAKTPEELYRPLRSEIPSPTAPSLGPTINGPLDSGPVFGGEESKPTPPEHQQPVRAAPEDSTPMSPVERSIRSHATPPQSQLIDSDSSPPPGKELTLFLQYKSKVKKFVLPEGYSELSIARLQLAFIEKFAWNTHNNGVDLPEIYIQDPVSGVRHELEDLSDVKDRCVLVLNVEALDEVKRHFDDGIGGLRKTLEGVRSLLDGQGSMMQRVSDRQLETSKEMARMSTVPNRAVRHAPTTVQGGLAAARSEVSLEEVQRLRRDIAVLRQTYATMSSDFIAAMNDIRAKAANVRSVVAEAAVPTYEGDAGRARINTGKKTFTTDSEILVGHVDDLQDRVEELRKDVVARGVRPLPRALEEMNRDIAVAVKDLAKMKEFLKREKPIWTKIWEQELALVCSERDDLTSHEDLVGDLGADLEELNDIFKLVEETMKQQNLQSGPGVGGLRSTSRSLSVDPDVDPQRAKDGVLGEVRALQPNHESRLEAIERAEKARQKELESRKGGEFQRDLEKFVEEGKLKRTGGADEVERLRKIKDERARKENFERLQHRQAESEARATADVHAIDGVQRTNAIAIDDERQPEVSSEFQDGEATFQDAQEDTGPTTASSPPPEGDDHEDEGSKRDSDGPPKLPEVVSNKSGMSEPPAAH